MTTLPASIILAAVLGNLPNIPLCKFDSARDIQNKMRSAIANINLILLAELLVVVVDPGPILVGEE